MIAFARVDYFASVGRATECVISPAHNPQPLRFVWHHILPEACGGRATRDNLLSVCDGCHYAIHALLWDLKQHDGVFTVDSSIRNRNRAGYAMRGWELAVAAGTTDRIPNEG